MVNDYPLGNYHIPYHCTFEDGFPFAKVGYVIVPWRMIWHVEKRREALSLVFRFWPSLQPQQAWSRISSWHFAGKRHWKQALFRRRDAGRSCQFFLPRRRMVCSSFQASWKKVKGRGDFRRRCWAPDASFQWLVWFYGGDEYCITLCENNRMNIYIYIMV